MKITITETEVREAVVNWLEHKGYEIDPPALDVIYELSASIAKPDRTFAGYEFHTTKP